MGAVNFNFAMRHGPLDDSGDLFNDKFLDGCHFGQDLLDGIAELEDLHVKLVVNVVLVFHVHVLLQHKHLLVSALYHWCLETLHHIN